MGGAFFDWDELDKAEGNEAAMMGGGGFFGTAWRLQKGMRQKAMRQQW